MNIHVRRDCPLVRHDDLVRRGVIPDKPKLGYIPIPTRCRRDKSRVCIAVSYSTECQSALHN